MERTHRKVKDEDVIEDVNASEEGKNMKTMNLSCRGIFCYWRVLMSLSYLLELGTQWIMGITHLWNFATKSRSTGDLLSYET